MPPDSRGDRDTIFSAIVKWLTNREPSGLLGDVRHEMIDVGKQLCYGAACFRSVARLRGASGVSGGIVMRDFSCTDMSCLTSCAPLAGEPKRSRVR
jgi:hypothetical protein